MSAMIARAISRYCTALNVSSGYLTSIIWWGTSRLSASDGLSVQMSKPIYTCIESAVTTSPSNRSAKSTANADLHAAVGPANTTSGLSDAGNAVYTAASPSSDHFGKPIAADVRPVASVLDDNPSPGDRQRVVQRIP